MTELKNILSKLIKSKISENITWLIIDKLIMLLVNLFVIVIVANHYGPTVYGLFQYVISIVAIIEVITLVLDGRIVKKQYSNYSSDVIVSSSTLVKIILSLIALFIGIIYMFIANKGDDFNFLLVLLLLNYIFINLAFGIKNHFEFILKSKRIVITSKITLIFSVALQILAVINDMSISVIPIIMVISSFLQFLILIVQYIKVIKPKEYFNIDFQLVKFILKESLPLAVAGFAATIYSMADTVMLGSMLSNYEVGIYSIANKLVTLMLILIGPITISIYPKMLNLFKEDRNKYDKIYIVISTLSTYFILFVSFVLMIITPLFFKTFMDIDYIKSIPIFNIRLLGVLFAYNSILRVSHFAITGKTSMMMYSQICAMIINVILNYFLISTIGIYGAAIATSITQMISLYLFNFVSREGRFVLNNQLKAYSPFNFYITLKRLININQKNT